MVKVFMVGVKVGHVEEFGGFEIPKRLGETGIKGGG